MTTTGTSLIGAPIKAHDLLRDGQRLISPRFQRTYVWAKAQIDELWEDIGKILQDPINPSPIFMGALVTRIDVPGTASVPRQVWLVDGQQRMTTLYLLITAAVETCQQHGWEDLATDLIQTYLLHTQSTNKNEPKLQPTLEDREQFNYIMQKLQSTKATNVGEHIPHAPNGLMINAYGLLSDKLRSQLQEGAGEGVTVQTIESFLDIVLGALQFVEIALGDEHDVYEVYERLNVAGVRLDIIDLIRNIVFSNVNDPNTAQIIYDEKWRPFETGFENITDEKTDAAVVRNSKHRDKYFFPFVQTINPQVTRSNLWTVLKSHWSAELSNATGDSASSEDKAERIILNLDRYRVPYNLITTGRSKGTTLDPEIQSRINALISMDIPDMTYTYLMQLVYAYLEGNIDKDQCVNAITFVDSYMVRRSFNGREANGIKAVFGDMWPRCGADIRKMIDKVDSNQNQLFPDDNTFDADIKGVPFYRRKLTNYVISEFERSRNSNLNDENLRTIEIDHVCPQDRTGEWLAMFTDEQHGNLLHTWANLVPLSKADNSSKGTSSWGVARRIYMNENMFKTTTDLAQKYDVWDAQAIGDRASELSDWARERWPHPVSMS